MKARCPKNPEHKRFIATATVLEEWLVDENGDFLSHANMPGEVTHKPSPGDVWSCEDCGADAIFVEEEGDNAESA